MSRGDSYTHTPAKSVTFAYEIGTLGSSTDRDTLRGFIDSVDFLVYIEIKHLTTH